MVSRTGVHAISALVALAARRPQSYQGAGEIAEQIGAPRNYLGKLLQTLTNAGLLQSRKGKGGGFRLARDPQAISLYDVIEPIEHVSRWNGCFFGQPICSDGAPCTVHQGWKKVRDAYLEFLKQTSVADLTRRTT